MPAFTWLPADEAPPEDVEAVLGSGGAAKCRCQGLKVSGWIWSRKQPWMRLDPELEGVWSVLLRQCQMPRTGGGPAPRVRGNFRSPGSRARPRATLVADANAVRHRARSDSHPLGSLP